jgi:MurNAc alpha-1-phosphate uridylyltransferase
MSHKKKGLILAAGFGTRLKAITNHIPKALVEVKKKAMLDHCIDCMRVAGIEEIAINLHYMPQKIEQHLEQRKNAAGLNIHLLHEPEILETGGAVLNAINKLQVNAELCVMNCDAYFPEAMSHNPFTILRQSFGQADAMLLLKPKSQLRSSDYSDTPLYLQNDAKLSLEPTTHDREGNIFTGAYILNAPIFQRAANQLRAEKFPLFDALKLLGCFGLRYEHDWHDIGTPQRLEFVERPITDA